FATGYVGLILGPDTTMLFDDVRVWSLRKLIWPNVMDVLEGRSFRAGEAIRQGNRNLLINVEKGTENVCTKASLKVAHPVDADHRRAAGTVPRRISYHGARWCQRI